ncbi:2557_t:CDS:2, partial [Racocetra persica]
NEDIIQSIQDLSFEEIAAINEEDLNKNLELSQQLKLVIKAESDVWKHVNKETRKCSYCSKIFAPTTATGSIRSHLQSQHKTLLNKEQLNFVIKKYSSEIQMEKTQAIFEWIILALKPFNVVENKAFQNMIQKLDPFYQIPKQILLIKHPNLKTYMPSKEEWKIYEDLVHLLEQFNQATIELSSQTYPTIAHAQIILLALRNELEQDKGENFQLQYVIDAMLSKFIEYFNLITESLHISAFLDPRYKNYCFSNMSIEEILTPIRKKIDLQLPLTVTKPKKLSSFYQKLKHTSQQTQTLDDE